jgi:hypothetical protein
MRRFFKGVLFICLATLMAACDNDTLQQEQKGDKIQISLSFNIGNSPLSIGGPMAGTKGVGEGLFDAIYEGIVSGEIVAAYELTFTNKSTGASTIFNGRWNDGKTISLEKGEYTITGSCTASGNGIYNQCSLTMQDEATVTEQTTSIKIKAQYDCSLLILNDENVDKVVYYASQNDSASFAKYKTLTYAFLKSSADFSKGGVAFLKVYFKNGYSSIVNLGQINIKKGNYYLLENLYNYADAGLVLDIDKMENGNDSNKIISLDGRWDGVPEGVQVGIGEQRITLIFDGNNVDLYIVAWGDHLRGTYTYENEKLNFSFKIEDSWDALIVDEYSSGWFAGDGALDPETFELKYTEELPYRWYQMSAEMFNTDVEFLKDFTFKIIDNNTAVGGPLNLKYIKRYDKDDNNESIENTEYKPIEFSVRSVSKTTKGAMSSNSDVANNGGFKVWGFKNVSTSSDWKTVFDSTTVSSSDYGSTWTYSPLRFWDVNAQYKFYAAAPAQNANGTITFADNTICVNNVHSAKKSDSDVECKVQRGVYSAWGSSPRTVEFTLSHIMANLVVKIKISDALSGYTVKLNNLQIEGWNVGNGNFKLNPERYSNADNAEWTIPVYSNGKLNMVDENGVLLSVDGKVIGDYLLIPQSIDENCTFKMTYTIISGGYSESYNYSLKMNQLYQALYTGCRYIATFTINPDVITFDATCLTDWEDGNNTIEIW